MRVRHIALRTWQRYFTTGVDCACAIQFCGRTGVRPGWSYCSSKLYASDLTEYTTVDDEGAMPSPAVLCYEHKALPRM